jgi:hypothetical protein
MTTVLLHDTIGSMTEAELAGRFGAETARLAFAFADPPLAPGAPDTWRARREAYLRKLATVDDAALLVVACEELHELGDLLHDLKYTGTKA